MFEISNTLFRQNALLLTISKIYTNTLFNCPEENRSLRFFSDIVRLFWSRKCFSQNCSTWRFLK